MPVLHWAQQAGRQTWLAACVNEQSRVQKRERSHYRWQNASRADSQSCENACSTDSYTDHPCFFCLFVCFFYTFSTQCLVHWLVNVSLHTHVTDHPEATTRNFHFIVHHWFWRSLWTKDEKDETTRIKSSVSLQASRLLGSPSALHNKTMFWLYYLSSPEKLEFSPMTGIKNNYNHFRNILFISLCSSYRGISVEAVP